jgi:putative sterol carrier protein
MSAVIEKAVEALTARLGDGFDGSVKFVISDEGAIMVDGGGVRAEDGEADVTLTADAETFEAILSGDLDPQEAFMSGRMGFDGDLGAAMRLGSALA